MLLLWLHVLLPQVPLLLLQLQLLPLLPLLLLLLLLLPLLLLLLPLLLLLLLLLLPLLLLLLLPLLPFVLELLLLLLLQLLLPLLLPRPGLVLLPLWLHTQHCLFLMEVYNLRRQQLSHLHPRRSRHSLRLRNSLLGGVLGGLLGGLLRGLMGGLLALQGCCLGRQPALQYCLLRHLGLQRLRCAVLLLVGPGELDELRLCEDFLLVQLAVWVQRQEHQRILQHSLACMLHKADESPQGRHRTHFSLQPITLT